MSAGVLLLLAAASTAAEVRITVEEPSGTPRRGWPVTSGIPLPQGEMRDPGAAALLTADGRQLPLQTEALVRWPDGSVRWLLLDFQLDLSAGEKKPLTLCYGPGIQGQAGGNPVQVH